MVFEMFKFIIYTVLIVLIAKYVLVKLLRKFAENLDLKPEIVGNVTGYATSIPELLSVIVASVNGLAGVSIVNIISSNVINFIQYIVAVISNKNMKYLKNKAIIINLSIISITIILPIFLMVNNIPLNLTIVPTFILIFILILIINKKVHEKFLKIEDIKLDHIIEKEQKWERKNKTKTIKYTIYIILTGIALFLITEQLGDVLLTLNKTFGMSEILIGILLGIATSIPELITFFETQKFYNKTKTNQFLGIVEATNNLMTSNSLNLCVIQTLGIILAHIFI